MNKILRVECKRGFYSIGFYLGIIILVLGGTLNAGNIMESMLEVEYVGSQVSFIESVYYAIHSEVFTFLIPVVCTLAMSASYVEDLQSGILNYILLRTTKKKYKWSKVLNCGLFGGLIVAIAILVLVGISFVRLPTNAIATGVLNPLYLLQISSVLCLNGSFYSLLGGTIATFMNNRYMAYAAPFIFYYVVSTLVDSYLAKMWVINPKEWMFVQLSSPTIVITILLILNVVTILGYLKIIERRWKND
jgi:hypothetical protein